MFLILTSSLFRSLYWFDATHNSCLCCCKSIFPWLESWSFCQLKRATFSVVEAERSASADESFNANGKLKKSWKPFINENTLTYTQTHGDYSFIKHRSQLNDAVNSWLKARGVGHAQNFSSEDLVNSFYDVSINERKTHTPIQIECVYSPLTLNGNIQTHMQPNKQLSLSLSFSLSLSLSFSSPKKVMRRDWWSFLSFFSSSTACDAISPLFSFFSFALIRSLSLVARLELGMLQHWTFSPVDINTVRLVSNRPSRCSVGVYGARIYPQIPIDTSKLFFENGDSPSPKRQRR